MIASELTFPIICFYRNLVRVEESENDLLITTTAGLKNGYFRNMLMVDSQRCAIQVKDAKKLHSVGRFWGYDIFLDQKIKVELIFEGETFEISLAEVKKRVLAGLRTYGGSVHPDYWKEVKQSIKDAETISGIMSLISK